MYTLVLFAKDAGSRLRKIVDSLSADQVIIVSSGKDATPEIAGNIDNEKENVVSFFHPYGPFYKAFYRAIELADHDRIVCVDTKSISFIDKASRADMVFGSLSNSFIRKSFPKNILEENKGRLPYYIMLKGISSGLTFSF
ncbi:MAG: hypothetical protein ACQEP1_03780 [Nanobdellota archaeon]